MPITALLAAVLTLSSLLPTAIAAAFEVQGGIEFVAVTGADPDTELVLTESDGDEVERGTADRFGSLIFRYLKAGRTYSVRAAAGGSGVPVTTLEFKDHPDASFYR